MSIKAKQLIIESSDEVFYPVVKFDNTTIKVYFSNNMKTGEAEEVVEAVAPREIVEEKKPQRVRRSRVRVLWSKIGTFSTALLCVFAAGLIGLKIAGYRTFTVLSGSMEPEFPVGSAILVKPVDYKVLKVGDVISYVANSDNTIVTHRIVKIVVDETDPSVLRYQTQGDANNSPDSKLVHYKNVLGTPVVVVPSIGYFAKNIQTPPGIYITLVVGTLLLAWTFMPETLEGRRRTARKV